MEAPYIQTQLNIPANGQFLHGDLSIPPAAVALIIFAHGSGSSRSSSRNRAVAEYLNKQGMATLLFDLLTPAEDMQIANRFNIALLADRLHKVTLWMERYDLPAALPLGFFGASTGAAAALVAAGSLPQVGAIVSRGGRPDLAGTALAAVKAPTLLIVGSLDSEVLARNKAAAALLSCPHRIEVVSGAGHLFTENGTLQKVAELAARWFGQHLRQPQLLK